MRLMHEQQPGGDVLKRPVAKLNKKLKEGAGKVYDAEMTIISTEEGPGRIIVRVGNQDNVGVTTALELLDKPGIRVNK